MSASGLNVAAVICRRELIRFARQPARIAAAIGTPLLLFAFLGSGFAGSFRPSGLADLSYMAFLLPGMMTLTAVFTAIFSSISIIEDRQAGWLQSALVAPVPRWSIAVGKMFGGGIVAWAQAATLLILAPLLNISLSWNDVLIILAALAVTSLAITGLGVAFAWHSESSAGFHAVMNLVFMPMWLLSSAFFPPPDQSGSSAWLAQSLAWLMRINPLTWCTQAIREPMLGGDWATPLVLTCIFAAVMTALATAIVARPSAVNA